MLGPLPHNALVAFEAAARHLSFARAADELHVTPAAISQQIRSLEDLLGVQLFRRHARSLSLTPAAEAGLPHLREGFDKITEGMSRLRDRSSRSSLNVWMAPSFASKWLVPRLQRFAQCHPDIVLSIVADNALMDRGDGAGVLPAQAFREHDVDVAIRFGRGVYPGCRVEKLMSAAAMPLCSPALLKKGKGRVALRRPDDLRFHTLLHDDTPYEGRPDWASWLEAAGIDDIDSTRGIHFNHVALALEAAADSQGVVLSIGQLASNDLTAGRLVVPFEARVPLEYAYYMISLEDAPNAGNVDAFRHWLAAEAAGQDEQIMQRAGDRGGR